MTAAGAGGPASLPAGQAQLQLLLLAVQPHRGRPHRGRAAAHGGRQAPGGDQQAATNNIDGILIPVLTEPELKSIYVNAY